MKKIKKPHFYTKLLSGVDTKEPVITETDFNFWYQEIIQKMFNEAVEIYWNEDDLEEGNGYMGRSKMDGDNRKGFIVHIEQIQEETSADVLKEYVNVPIPYEFNKGGTSAFTSDINKCREEVQKTFKFLMELKERAKAALERENGN